MKRKPVAGIAQKTESELLAFSEHILASMTNNANFPTPVPSIANLNTAHDLFAAAMSGYERGNVRKTIDKTAKRKTLESMLTRLANYVEITADGNADKILSSGFSLSKERETRAVPEPPLISKITDGIHSGDVVVHMSPGHRGETFTVAHKLADEEGDWNFDFGKTRRDIEVGGLEPGKFYLFKAQASNAAGNSEWSAEVRFVVR